MGAEMVVYLAGTIRMVLRRVAGGTTVAYLRSIAFLTWTLCRLEIASQDVPPICGFLEVAVFIGRSILHANLLRFPLRRLLVGGRMSRMGTALWHFVLPLTCETSFKLCWHCAHRQAML